MKYREFVAYLIQNRGLNQSKLRDALFDSITELKTILETRLPLVEFSQDKSFLFPGSREELASTGISMTMSSNGIFAELFEEIGISGITPILFDIKDALDSLIAMESQGLGEGADIQRQKLLEMLDRLQETGLKNSLVQ